MSTQADAKDRIMHISSQIDFVLWLQLQCVRVCKDKKAICFPLFIGLLPICAYECE